MKIIFITVFFFFFTFLFADGEEEDILKILNQASKYKTPKYPKHEIYDPFRKATPAIKKAEEVKVKPTPPVPVLKAIINNTAYIDGRWREVGDDINGYKIAKIADEVVILKLGERNITLSVTRKSNNFIEISK